MNSDWREWPDSNGTLGEHIDKKAPNTATETGQGLEPLWDEDRIWEYADRRTKRYSGEVKNYVRYEVSECMRLMLTEIHNLTDDRAKTHATIAAQTQQIAALEAELAKTQATLRHTIAENMALIDELDGDDEDE